MTIKVNHNKCQWQGGNCSCGCACSSNDTNCGCGGKGCAKVCPIGAIKREDVVIIDNSKCIECGACVKACPFQALSMV